VKQESCDSHEDKKIFVGLQRELVTLQIHLLKKVIKVNVQGIFLPIIRLLLIMLSMVNLHVKMEEKVHVHIVV
jgi:hypothetical protein